MSSSIITMKYGLLTITIEQKEIDETVLRVKKNNRHVGCLFGTEILGLLDRKRSTGE